MFSRLKCNNTHVPKSEESLKSIIPAN